MIPRITKIEVANHRFDPTEAELRISVMVAPGSNNLQIRGRTIGPRCLYASTVEVAYPLRALAMEALEPDILAARVIIPEPCAWEPASPFLYHGIVELWQADQRLGQTVFERGLRQLQIGPRGAKLNGRPLHLHVKEIGEDHTVDLHEVRASGFNCVLVQLEPSDRLWSEADRIGLLVIGRIGPATSVEMLNAFARHPSCIACVFESKEGGRAATGHDKIWTCASGRIWLGLDVCKPSNGTRAGVDFLVCRSQARPLMIGSDIPLLVRVDRRPGGDTVDDNLRPAIIGSIS
jgi:hypothetical protein